MTVILLLILSENGGPGLMNVAVVAISEPDSQSMTLRCTEKKDCILSLDFFKAALSFALIPL